MNNENFQEMLSDGRILEIALQYVLQAGITKKKDGNTENMTGYLQELLVDMDTGARTGILLNRLGITPNLKGLIYLRKAIELEVDGNSSMNGMMKCLYPQVASLCDASPSSVERNIRHAIEVMWERGNRELYQEITNHYVQKRPSNGQFITSIAAYFRDRNILMH